MEPASKEVMNLVEHNVDGIEHPFYFESDHVALKGNADYQAMLKTVAVLEAQRSKALCDIDKLLDLRDRALKDPLTFVGNLQRRVDMGIPQPQIIAQLPNIEWEKYATTLGDDSFRKHATRGKQLDVRPLLRKKHKSSASAAAPVATSEGLTVVRGRVKDDNKPETFNQLWTSEEQRRLEELLVQFPPEEVEAHRFQKIADALGNRTYHQVASRIQKYFIKLAKAGLPVPGRVPNLSNYHSKNKGPRRHKRYAYLHSSTSTMLQSYMPPVYMAEHDDDDDDEDMSYISCSRDAGLFAPLSRSLSPTGSATDCVAAATALSSPDCTVSASFNGGTMTDDMVDIPDELRDTDEFKELLCLQRLKEQKLRSGTCSSKIGDPEPCDRLLVCYCCSSHLTTSAAWRCGDCNGRTPVYLCKACLREQVSFGCHDGRSHTAIRARTAPIMAVQQNESSGSFVDRDYVASNFNIPGCNNYLDPNYMPAA